MAKKAYHHGDLKKALIEAGIEILAREGVYGLSLRKAASKAGVSHSAPYAHFSDKQALVAAISTQGLSRLYDRIEIIHQRFSGVPLRELVEIAWAYLSFAIDDPAHFKITFSGAIEKEQDYPALAFMIRENFEAVQRVIELCQAAGLLNPGPTDVITVSVWSQVHGLTSLLLESQLSHTLLERISIQSLLIACLQQQVRVPIDPHILDGENEPLSTLPTASG